MTNTSSAALNVMIVDDDTSVADVAAAVLSKAGCNCTIADQSQDLLEQIKTARPDIVIVDIMMPQVDGLELCRQTKTEEDLSRSKVIVLSGKAKTSISAALVKWGQMAMWSNQSSQTLL